MPPGTIRFGPFELDPENFELRRAGRRVKLDRTPLELLIYLAQRAGKLVRHDEAVERIWGKEVFIEAESGLYTAIRKIRKALGDHPTRPQYIETVSRKGYRFVGLIPRKAGGSESEVGRPVRLAVLPLDNLSGNPAREYFSDGLTEELITVLGMLSPRELGVIARTSVMRFKGAKKSITEIGRELGVDYVIEGSARHDRGRVRIAIQLIRASDQTHVWAESYERPLRDIHRVQSEVAQAVAQRIRLKLAAGSSTARPLDPEVYDSYLRGRSLWDHRTAPSIRSAMGYFEKALQSDPHYAQAWAALATCYATLAITSDARPRDCFPKAGEAVRAGSRAGRFAAGGSRRPWDRSFLVRLGMGRGGTGIPEGMRTQPERFPRANVFGAPAFEFGPARGGSRGNSGRAATGSSFAHCQHA